jgi:hypothetical protein
LKSGSRRPSDKAAFPICRLGRPWTYLDQGRFPDQGQDDSGQSTKDRGRFDQGLRDQGLDDCLLNAYRLVGESDISVRSGSRLTGVEIIIRNGHKVVRKLKGGAAKVTRNGGTGFRVTVDAFA